MVAQRESHQKLCTTATAWDLSLHEKSIVVPDVLSELVCAFIGFLFFLVLKKCIKG